MTKDFALLLTSQVRSQFYDAGDATVVNETRDTLPLLLSLEIIAV